MKPVLIYSTRICPYCVMARRLLSQRGIPFEDVRVDDVPEQRSVMLARSNGRRTVPQIFFGEQHVGGFQELAMLDRSGRLTALLQDD
jgi:Glutaredoxin, GrxC family